MTINIIATPGYKTNSNKQSCYSITVSAGLQKLKDHDIIFKRYFTLTMSMINDK